MRNRLLAYIVIGVVIAASGCHKASNQTALMVKDKSLVKPVESSQLAELILKPKGRQFTVSRDPFKPIVSKEEMAYAESIDTSIPGEDSPTDNIVLVGVVRMDNEYRAFIKYNDKTGVFKVQDKVASYIIKDINLNQIVLVSGDHEIIKKRGEI